MAIKLLVALLCVLFSTAATQPCYPPYPQELINSMGPTLSPSSSSFPPTPTASIESNPTTPVVPALFVIGDSLWHHQLPRNLRPCRPPPLRARLRYPPTRREVLQWQNPCRLSW
ncbi:hypothetical protein ACFX2I_014835 [Malus domestica]